MYGIFKIWTGIYFKSAWIITFGIYYLLLCFMKSSVVLTINKDEFGKNMAQELKKLKQIGTILLLLNVILIGIIILIIHQNQTIEYPGYLIYIVAMYDFYLIISAFINVLKNHTKNSPVSLLSLYKLPWYQNLEVATVVLN